MDLALAAKVIGISSSFLASGGIFSLSIFTTPAFKDMSSRQSIISNREMFSTGSHIFPPLAVVSGSTFAYLAYVEKYTQLMPDNMKVYGYLAAAASALAIAPYTTWYMVPSTNQALLDAAAAEKKGKDGVEEVGGKQNLQETYERFIWQNAGRGVLTGISGFVGLYTALL